MDDLAPPWGGETLAGGASPRERQDIDVAPAGARDLLRQGIGVAPGLGTLHPAKPRPSPGIYFWTALRSLHSWQTEYRDRNQSSTI